MLARYLLDKIASKEDGISSNPPIDFFTVCKKKEDKNMKSHREGQRNHLKIRGERK